MSYQATEYVSKLRHGITGPEKKVLRAAAHHHNTKSGVAIFSIPELAADCMANERTIYRNISRLEVKNLLEKVSGGGRSKPSVYRFPGLMSNLINPDISVTLSAQQTLTFGTENPDTSVTKPCHLVHETMTPVSVTIRKEGSTRFKEKRQGENPPPHAPTKTDFSQADFDAMDLRKMHAAYHKFETYRAGAVGDGLTFTPREVFEWVCVESGITVQRGLDLEEHQKKWPAAIPQWAQTGLKEIENAS